MGLNIYLKISLFALIIILLCTIVSTTSYGDTDSYKVDVNIKQNIIIVYKKTDNNYTPEKAMICSAGKLSTPTPTGVFTLGYKKRWLRMINDGEVSYGQYTGLIDNKEQIYFHSVPYDVPRKDSQFTEDFNALGTNASLGCIRLSVIDAKWIYDNIPEGTKIEIYSSDKNEPLKRPTMPKVSTRNKLGWDPTDPDPHNPNFNSKSNTLKKAIKIKGQSRLIKQMESNAILNIKCVGPEGDMTNNITSTIIAPNRSREILNYEAAKSYVFDQIGPYEITYSIFDPYILSTIKKTFYVDVAYSKDPSCLYKYDTWRIGKEE